jgi:hypothetical protein
VIDEVGRATGAFITVSTWEIKAVIGPYFLATYE